MTIVAAIDVGLVNMGLAVLDTTLEDGLSRPALERSSLLTAAHPRYSESDAFMMVKSWIDARWERVFAIADLILIEKQMAESMGTPWERKFLVLEAHLQSYLAAKERNVRVVRPVDVRRWAGCSRGSHAGNKHASIDFARRRIDPDVLLRAKRAFGAKLDDMCDAYQTALYGAAVVLAPEAPRRRKRRRVEPTTR